MSDKESSASEASASESSASASSASEASSSEAVKKEKKKKSKKEHKKEKKEKKHGKEKKEKKSKSKDKKDKKEKTKGGKRGPKGAQWKTWKIPFQEKSILGSSFQMGQKKGGVDEKKLIQHIKKNKGTPAFILRILKRGYNRGWKWEVDDSHGRLRILHAKIDKHWKKK